MPTGSFGLKVWALMGAQQRLRELDEERAQIVRAFPELRGGGGSEVGSGRTTGGGGTGVGSGRTGNIAGNGRRGPDRPSKVATVASSNGGIKPKRTMSAEARQKISLAQKRRWAKARAGK